ncbi:MAG: MFS transporter [Chitinophagales bacterium]|nr:MFS transporter [Chitinophagales bacterium]
MIKGLIRIYKDAFSGLSGNIWLLGLIMFINRGGAMILPFMTLYLTKEFNYTLADAGWIMTAFGAGSIVGAYTGGQLTDKYGYYYIQLGALIGSAVFSILLLMAHNFWLIWLMVFLFSMVADSLRPANSVAIALFSKPENRTRSFSLMRFAINLGYAVGPAIAGIIAEYFGYSWIFIMNAVTSIIAAVVLFKYLPYVSEHVPEAKGEQTELGKSAYKDWPYLKFTMLTAVWAILFFQLFTSVPVYWSGELGLSESQIGQLLGLNGLIIVIIEMPIIRRIEHITKFMEMIALGSIMLILSFVILGVGIKWVSFAVLYIIFITLAELFAMPFMINFAVSRPAEGRRGQYMALYSMSYGIANIIAPILGMQLAENLGFSPTFMIFAGISILVTIFFFRLRYAN